MTKKIKGIVPRPKNPNNIFEVTWMEEEQAIPVTDLPYFGIIDFKETST